eukprot:Skav207500  [mRNA]  locus=scaffold334:182410:184416:- [translate_table: standard]
MVAKPMTRRKCNRWRALSLLLLVRYALGFVGSKPLALSRDRRPVVGLHADKDEKSEKSEGTSSGGFFKDPLDGTPYETNETTGSLILAVAGAVIVVFFLIPFLQSYFETISTPPP